VRVREQVFIDNKLLLSFQRLAYSVVINISCWLIAFLALSIWLIAERYLEFERTWCSRSLGIDNCALRLETNISGVCILRVNSSLISLLRLWLLICKWISEIELDGLNNRCCSWWILTIVRVEWKTSHNLKLSLRLTEGIHLDICCILVLYLSIVKCLQMTLIVADWSHWLISLCSEESNNQL